MEPIIKELGKDRWDLEVFKEYFLRKHNGMVEKGFEFSKEIPRTLKELCKVHRAEITNKNGDVLTVRYGDRTRTVLNILVPNAKIGDVVTIHYGYACEVIS